MRSRIPDEEWDRAWAEFDAEPRAPAPVAPAVPAPPVERRPRVLALTVLTAVMVVVSATTQSVSRDQLPHGAARQSLVSISPTEADLPPVEVAIGRLANESALAACWAMALLPREPGCPPSAAR